MGERIVRGDDHKIDLILYGKVDDPMYIGRFHIDADCVLRDSAVAGRAVQRADLSALGQFFYDGMLPSPAANHQYVHLIVLLMD